MKLRAVDADVGERPVDDGALVRALGSDATAGPGNRSGTPYGTAAAATAAQAPASQADCGKSVSSRSTVTARSSAMAS